MSKPMLANPKSFDTAFAGWLHGEQYVWVAVGAAAAIALVVLAVSFFLLTRRRERRGTFALVGICNAGKTALFYKLRHGTLRQTHTSMQTNDGTFALHAERESADAARAAKKPVRVVDVPGHQKLRFVFHDLEKELGGIVFVVDAAEFHQEFRNVAEYLYDILSSHWVVKNKVPVLVACNKTDIKTAQTKERIQTQLEAEFNQLRTTRSAAPERQADDSGNAGTGTSFLGFENKPFVFGDVENEVVFAECAVTNDTVDSIAEWIRAQYPY